MFRSTEEARAAAAKLAAMKRAQKEERSKGPVVSGIGESKVFVEPGERDPYGSLRGLHIGGKPIEEVIPPDRVHLISFDHTDEGIAARNAGKSDTHVSVTDTFDRQLERMEREPWEGADVIGEIVQSNVSRGFRARFLSPRVVDRSGRRGWEIVTKGGDPVRLGNLMLAVMPEEKAEKRNAYFREQAQAEVQRVREEFVEQGRRLSREAGAMGLRALEPGEVVRDGHSGRQVGLGSVRGNQIKEE